jgi:PAS domain S-box-containing protein
MFKWFRKSAISKQENPYADEGDWDGLFKFLVNHVSDPFNAKELVQVGKQGSRKTKQERFQTYLLFERYLINLNQKKYTKKELRGKLLKDFSFLQEDPVFRILFLPDAEARAMVVSCFLEFCLNYTNETFGKSLQYNFIEEQLTELISIDCSNAETEVFADFSEICNELFDHVTSQYGIGLAASIFHHSYEMCAATYKEHEAFPSIITILPKPIITEQQLNLLTQNQVESLFLEKLELTKKLNEALEQEIKEKSDAQNKLKGQELMLRSLISSALDAIITINDQGKLIAWNPSAETIFGYKAEEVYGKQLADLIIPPALREMHHKGFARFMATKESTVVNKGRLELPAITKDGKDIKVELTITSVVIDGSYYFNGFLRDITAKDIES